LTRRKTGHAAWVYTDGELNKLVDAFVHPLIKHDPRLVVIDATLHAIIERNPSESILKFIRYALRDLLSNRKRRRK
jgi:hypothetical protein